MKPITTTAAVLALVSFAGQLDAAEPQLAHMVFFTLAEDTEENRDKLVAACQEYLSDHEGTVYFSVGVINEDLDREVNDRDFDVALHLVFANPKAHDTYQNHPRHLKFIEENKDLWSTVRVFDSNIMAPGHEPIPEGGQGFAGMLTGKVVAKQYGQVVLEVAEINKTWRHNKAEEPQSLVSKKVLVTARDGNATIDRFLGLLKVGGTVAVDVAHKKGDALTILELSEKQRERIQP